jgi:hypothetical protein
LGNARQRGDELGQFGHCGCVPGVEWVDCWQNLLSVYLP